MKKGIWIAVLGLVFASCEKEEKPYQLPPAGDAVVQQVNMGEDYSKVIFYDLDNENFYIEELAQWDLALECAEKGVHALMNGGTGTQVAAMGDTNFTALYDVMKAEWRWDPPSFNVDSTAVGEWADSNFTLSREVYLLDRGENTSEEQYKKLQLVEVSETHYLLRTANLDGSHDRYIRVEKDPKTSFVNVNLDKGQLEKYEPAKEEWDFMFVRYRYVYYDMEPIVPYEVNGVILNPYRTSVADTRMAFDSVTRGVADTMTFSSRRDYIGFDWKYYSFDKEAYITDTKRVFVIRSHSGYYYKLRFIDFYDAQGVKGAPTFEFKRL